MGRVTRAASQPCLEQDQLIDPFRCCGSRTHPEREGALEDGANAKGKIMERQAVGRRCAAHLADQRIGEPALRDSGFQRNATAAADAGMRVATKR